VESRLFGPVSANDAGTFAESERDAVKIKIVMSDR